MHEKIERYREHMIRKTVRLHLEFLKEVNEINVSANFKDVLIQYIKQEIKKELSIYVTNYSEFSVMEFVTTDKRLFDIYKSLGHTKCETTKQILTTHAKKICP